MAKELKQIICGDLRRIYAEVDGCVLIDYRGLNSEQTESLRSSLREGGVRMNVLTNRLARRVFADLGAPEGFCDLIQGPTAVLFGGDGAFTASKSLKKWHRENRDVAAVRGGLFEGRALSADDVQRLADIPEPEVLRSNLMGCFLSPLTHLSSCAAGLVQHLAGCAKAQAESQGGSDESQGDD